jgi:carbamoyltransferase
MKNILGIRFGHDASASLVMDGKIVADAAEERFTRIKNDGSFPINAIRFCLEFGGIGPEELDALAVPAVTLAPAFAAYFDLSAVNLEAPSKSMLHRLKKVIGGYMEPALSSEAPQLPLYLKPLRLSPGCRIIQVPHHLAHAASAYFTAGLEGEKALIVTMDGRGDNVSVALWRGEGHRITSLAQWDGTASLGWFYSAVTEALGWRHGSDEWKVMGLAPYGEPQENILAGFHPVFQDGQLAKRHDYGAPGRLMDHGVNHYHLRDSLAIAKLVDRSGREAVAASAQRLVEEQAAEIIFPWLEREQTRHLCCAGGVFLNVKMNQRIWYSGKVDSQWIFPNPGDSGLAAGAALYAYYSTPAAKLPEPLGDLYLGPKFADQEVKSLLDERKLDYEVHDRISEVAARLLADGYIIAWFQGRMESGPRALGNRSILMSPLRAENKDIINACVKYREAFRPFCPALLYEAAGDYLLAPREEPYMITSFDVTPDKAPKIPAVVHVDQTLRPQTVRREVNPRFYDLIKAFGDLTGEYIILNTSFNVKGEPIICHPREAVRCFFDTGLDCLIMGNYLLRKPGRG